MNEPEKMSMNVIIIARGACGEGVRPLYVGWRQRRAYSNIEFQYRERETRRVRCEENF